MIIFSWKLLFTVMIPLFIITPTIAMGQEYPIPRLPNHSIFWNMRFSLNFPNGWDVMQNMPNEVKFISQNSTARVIIGWGFPTHIPNWFTDKGAWLQNMTKQGLIVNKIDNTVTLANHTALLISYIDNNYKDTIVVTQINGMILYFAYLADVNDYPTNEDTTNSMLNTLHINSWMRSFIDSNESNNQISLWGLK